MLGLVSNYNTAEHTIIGGEIGRWVSRLIKGDPQRKNKLFVVRYNKLGVFCICEWLAGPKDVFVDVFNLGKSLQSFTREKAKELKRRLFSPLSAEVTSREIIRNDSDFYHNLQDEDAEETERQERVAIGE